MKRKYIRAKEAPFMTKELHKGIMTRSRLRNKVLKNKNEINRNNYKVPNVLCDIKHVNILMKSTTTLKLNIFIK